MSPGVNRPVRQVMWINHLDLLPGDSSVTTTHDAVSSGVGGGLAALVVHSSTTGENAAGGGNKGVWRGLQGSPGFHVRGVRLCDDLAHARPYISQVRSAQVQNPPATAVVLLDDPTNHTAVGPVCVDVKSPTIDPAKGALLLDLRVNFGNTSDR